MAIVRGVEYNIDEAGQPCIRVSFDAREPVLRQLRQRISRMRRAQVALGAHQA
jgi:hypothetical protein